MLLRRRGGNVACGWPAAAFCCSALSPSAVASCRSPRILHMVGREDIPHDRQSLVPPLLADHRAARDAAHCERRELCVLLLWLLYRLSGEEREERRVGGGLALDPPRRGRLSLHEHHVVQPPAVCRCLHRCRCEAASLGSPPARDLRDTSFSHSRRTIPSRDLARWRSGELEILPAHRCPRRCRLHLFGFYRHRTPLSC